MNFQISNNDSSSSARTGIISTFHGDIRTPAFMPVGTQGTVKALSFSELNECGADIILGNTYHLYLRPGTGIVSEGGGLQKFISWNKPMLTDSGGFQVFSLTELNKINDDGVWFQSHIDGSRHFFTPEKVIEIERNLGADIIMPLDYPIAYPADEKAAAHANEITIVWARQSKAAFEESENIYGYDQFLFGIAQGSVFPHLRKYSIEKLVEIGFNGYALGGLAVGEPVEMMYDLIQHDAEYLPSEKPRYVMGIGTPPDLLTAIEAGIDMFDCVLPSRNARNGSVFTSRGKLNIKNAQYMTDFAPLDPNCDCMVCKKFSRAYIRHIYIAREILALRLLTYHSIYFYQTVMQNARNNIKKNNFSNWKKQFLKEYNNE